MTVERLTSDNFLLSRVTLGQIDPAQAPTVRYLVGDADTALTPEAKALIAQSLAPNTERAYRADLAHFNDWGASLPASPATVASYIAAHAGSLSVATLQRRVASLGKAHAAMGFDNPCRSEMVTATLRGLKRQQGSAQDQAKPLLREELFLVLDRIGSQMADLRDRALLLLGWAGGFRRSELTGLTPQDLTPVRQGVVVTLRRSKTDQAGVGRKIGIPHGRTRHCPVTAIESWTTAGGITGGALFRPVNRHGQVSDLALTGDAVSVILRRRLTAAGIDPSGYSGHSLRAGFATSAAQAGVPTNRIRAQTGHASDAMLLRYIRDGEMFDSNAAAALL